MKDSYYVLSGKHAIPRFVLFAVGSWVIALGAVTAIGLMFWLASSLSDWDVLKALPRWLSILVGLSGAYAAIGAICLYVTMWVYWIAVEREPLAARIGWFFALLLGLHYGAMIYAMRVWRTRIRKVEGIQPTAAA